MIRWHYLVPRLVILGLILLLGWLSVDPILKYAVVNSTESVTGAKVDVGKVETSMLEGKIYISDLAISDPRDPMKNLLQADVAYLKLDPRRLLHKELVVEHGHSTQVVFGSPRTVSGDLQNRNYEPVADSELPKVTVKTPVAIDSRIWLDQFQLSDLSSTERNLEVVRVAGAVKEKWPAVFEAHAQKIAQAKARLERLSGLADGPLVNPLPGRDLEKNQQRRTEINQLAEEVVKARTDLQQLVAAAEADRQQIAAAKARDEQSIASKVQTNQINASSVSQLLLQKQQAEYASEVVSWVLWFRNAIPNPEKDFSGAVERGTNITFKGQAERPSFLVKTLDLDGQGSLAGQHFKFAGVAKNLTNEPMLHDQPATFELRAQGSHHLIVDCTLDRRQPIWKDRMVVKGPELDAPSQLLGDPNSLEIEMANSRIQVDLDIGLEDNYLKGSLNFTHSNCAMLVNQLHQIAGGDDVKLRMNQELLHIDQFQTTASLGGTLSRPTIEFQSDLGEKLAGAMNQILKAKSELQIAELKTRLENRYVAELQQVDTMLNDNFRKLAEQLDGEATAVAELLENLPETERWPKIR